MWLIIMIILRLLFITQRICCSIDSLLYCFLWCSNPHASNFNILLKQIIVLFYSVVNTLSWTPPWRCRWTFLNITLCNLHYLMVTMTALFANYNEAVRQNFHLKKNLITKQSYGTKKFYLRTYLGSTIHVWVIIIPFCMHAALVN